MTGKFKRTTSLWLGAVSVIALTHQVLPAARAADAVPAKADAASVKPYDPSWGFNMSGMDKAVRPGDTFFQ